MAPIPTATSAANLAEANWAGNRGGRFKGRGSSRGSYRGRGNSYKGRGNNRGNLRGDRNNSRVDKNKGLKLGKDQCAKCKKIGHWKNECWGKEVEINTNRRNDDNANLAEAKKDLSVCLTFHTESMSNVKDLEQALSTTPLYEPWKLDSGATRYFSEVKSDFQQLKR